MRDTPTSNPSPARPKASRLAKPASPKPAERFFCEFCKHSYVTERALLVHVCEPKRRHLQRDEKSVKMGFIAYQRFFQTSMAKKKLPTYEAFAKSKLYGGFVRFGRYLMGINALNPLLFIDFLIRAEVGIDRWEQASLYETYVRELNKSETPMEALERNFMLMQQWSVETGDHWTEFFRKISPAQATLWIQSGRISPWIILTAPSAETLMRRLSPEQIKLVDAAIDKDFWSVKLQRHEAAVADIRHELTAAGI